MSTKSLTPLIAVLILASLACSIGAPSSQADPDTFNTQVAQTALARPTVALAVTAPPTAVPPTSVPTITPTQGPPALVSTTVSLPRHTALDLDTQVVSGLLSTIAQNSPDLSKYYKNAPAGFDLVFYAENPTAPDWQFLYPINGVRIAIPKPAALSQVSYEGCVKAFGGGEGGVLIGPNQKNEAFPLDFYVFITAPGAYFCFITDRGNAGAFKLTAPGDYIGMPYVIIDYIIWDATIP